MNSIVESMITSFVLGHLASGAAADGTAIQAGFDAWLGSVPVLTNHPQVKQALEDAADPLIAAVAKALQDTADLKTAITNLASKNYAAAAAALLAAAKVGVPGLGALVA